MTAGRIRLASFVMAPALGIGGITAIATPARAIPTVTCQSASIIPNQSGSGSLVGGGCVGVGGGRTYVKVIGGPTYDCGSVLVIFVPLTGRIIALGSNCTLV